jgi:deoxyribonuclease V
MSRIPSAASSIPDLYKLVYDLTAQVPEGRVTTYGAIARALGDVKAARAIGAIEHENIRPVLIPCHRVVYADGGLSGFGAPGGTETKKKLLKIEGVRVRDGKIVDFEKKLYTDFDVPGVRPLEKLRKLQDKLKKNVELKNGFDKIDSVCGLDIAYAERTAYGAAVVVDHVTKEVIDTVTVKTKVSFPYIPTYLAFRELPVIMRLMEKLDYEPTLLIMDGNGILHPRGFGVASHVGVVLDIPVLGAAKKKLCGTFDDKGLKSEGDSSPVKLDGRTVGHALKSSPRSSKPVFISPGHRVATRSALTIARHFTGNRMLLPVKEAHMLANDSRRKNE